jgi:hypothetical protein
MKNVIFYYRWRDYPGKIGLPWKVEDVQDLTIKEIKQMWPKVAYAYNIKTDEVTLMSIDITVR